MIPVLTGDVGEEEPVLVDDGEHTGAHRNPRATIPVATGNLEKRNRYYLMIETIPVPNGNLGKRNWDYLIIETIPVPTLYIGTWNWY